MGRLVAVTAVEVALVETYVAMIIGEISAHVAWVQRRIVDIVGALVVCACVLIGADLLTPLSKTGWEGRLGYALSGLSLLVVIGTVVVGSLN